MIAVTTRLSAILALTTLSACSPVASTSPLGSLLTGLTSLLGFNGFMQNLTSAVPDILTTVETAVLAQEAESLVNELLFAKLELEYSYGQSPPVYPSPIMAGSGANGWSEAFSLARSMVQKMTMAQKATLAFGDSQNSNFGGCGGFIPAIPQVGFPGLCLNDGQNGIRGGSMVSGYAAQIHVGASWNRDLAADRGYYMGREFKAKGINVATGPVAAPLGRIAKGGRNWEGFSNDPYLAGTLSGPTTAGLQKSVIACAKHWIGYEQETNRNPFLLDLIPQHLGAAISSNIDDRTMHELYLWPFYDIVRENLGAMMCSYNRINNSYACQNSKAMNGLLKTELGFQGFVLSDAGAVQSGVASYNSGMDVALPGSPYLDPNSFQTAVKNGSINSTRLDDIATRVVAAWSRFAPFEQPGPSNYANVDAQDPASFSSRFQTAVEGHVLVKNNGVLPLSKPHTLSVFGYDAIGGLNATHSNGLITSILVLYGLANTQSYSDGTPFTPVQMITSILSMDPDPHAGPLAAFQGTLLVGAGSGTNTPNHSTSVFDALQQEAAKDGTTLHYDFTSVDPEIVAPADPCLVVINAQACESWDRSSLSDDGFSDQLVMNVASRCKNTIVVIHNAGVRVVDMWIDHPNVTAVIYAHLPGQESGNSLAEILYGRQSPSGRLPYTVAHTEDDYGAILNPSLPDPSNTLFPQSNFSEGLFIDYRYFIQQNIKPRFEFGYGLTYSNFSYSQINVAKSSTANFQSLPPDHGVVPVPQGGLDSLYDTLATVTVTVTNTGHVAAAEVAQLYVNIPGSGVPKQLRGYDKQLLQPKASSKFVFPLRRRDLSVWDTIQQQWILNRGTYQFMIGKSVLDIQLKGSLKI